MKTLFTLLVMQLVCCITFATTPTDNKKISVNGQSFSHYRVVPMPDGGSLLVSCNNMASTQEVIRLNPQGQTQWAKSFMARPDVSYFHDAGAFADNSIYVVYGKDGYGDYFIIKLTADGQVEWTDEFDFSGLCYEAPVTVRTLADGGMVFVPRLFNSMAAIRLDANGAVTSSYRTADTSTKVMCTDAFARTTGGGIIITGKNDSKPVVITVPGDNSPVQVVTYEGGMYNRPFSIIKTYDDNYLMAGLSTEGDGAFVMKLAPGGAVLWANDYTALLQTEQNKTLTAITQLIENADHTISAVGYGGSSTGPGNQVLGVYMKLGEMGQPLSAYSFITTGGSQAFINDVYPRMYETSGSALMISTEEYDTTAAHSDAVLLNPAVLPDYCKANSFTPTVTAKVLTAHVSGSLFAERALPTVAHPVITTQNSTATFMAKDLCGVAIGTGVNDVAAATEVSLMPNPVQANGEVTVKWGDSQLPNGSILLYDVAGRLIKQINVTQGSQATFSTTNLQPGMYMCQLVNAANEKVATQKLLVTE